MSRVKYTCILGISLILVACGKYENGPSFSLLTKKTRLVRAWEIEEILYNEEPVTFNAGVMNSVYTFDKDQGYSVVGEGPQGTINEYGTWEFDDKKEHVMITLYGTTSSYRISRLKNTSLWLKQDTSGGTLLFKYIPHE